MWNRNFIYDNILEKMEEELNKVLPISFSKYVYSVIDGKAVLLQFVLLSFPTDEELQYLSTKVTDILDSILPVGEKVSTWIASVEVGAKVEEDLAIGGETVYQFVGSTKKYGSGIRYKVRDHKP